MNGSEPRQHFEVDADRILSELSNRQYLNPHTAVTDVLAEVQQLLGFCPVAASTALGWLGLDPLRAIGRLRRSELIQLARSIHRFWLQALADTSHGTPA